MEASPRVSVTSRLLGPAGPARRLGCRLGRAGPGGSRPLRARRRAGDPLPGGNAAGGAAVSAGADRRCQDATSRNGAQSRTALIEDPPAPGTELQ